MTSLSDLEAAFVSLGSGSWFYPTNGYQESCQPRLWEEDFDVDITPTTASGPLTWQDDLDVTAELTPEGLIPVKWLGPLNATHAELFSVDIYFKGNCYLSIPGLAIQAGCNEACSFNLEREFWIAAVPSIDGTVSMLRSSGLLGAWEELGQGRPMPAEDLLPILGLRPDD